MILIQTIVRTKGFLPLISSCNRASSTLASTTPKSSDHYEKYSLTPGEVYNKKVEFEEVSDDDDNDDEGKPDNHNKTRKEPQKSGPVESENLINIADDTEIFDLTKKTVGGSRSGVEKEEKGGLITTWKEIRTAAGALPQKIRTIIVPLHKVNLKQP